MAPRHPTRYRQQQLDQKYTQHVPYSISEVRATLTSPSLLVANLNLQHASQPKLTTRLLRRVHGIARRPNRRQKTQVQHFISIGSSLQ